jgi:hypothetical protein
MSTRWAVCFLGELCIKKGHYQATNSTGILCIPPSQDTYNLAPCDHEEADTQMFVHVADSVNKGYRKIYAQLIQMLLYSQWQPQPVFRNCMWIAFGTAKSFRHMPRLVGHLPMGLASPLLCRWVFHAYTGRVWHSIIFHNKGGKVSMDHLYDVNLPGPSQII